MKTTVKLINTDDLICEITVRMTVHELRKLKEQIDKATDWLCWPLAGFRETAMEAIAKTEREFYAEQELNVQQ